jgi:hypothetical protein
MAAAAASDRVVRDTRLEVLVGRYPVVYEPTGQDRLRPTAEFSGFRNSRLIASISSRPAAPRTVVEQFKVACRTLAALEVDSAVLLAGAELLDQNRRLDHHVLLL